MNAPTLNLQALRDLYDDIELSILFDYFQLRRPNELVGIDTEASLQHELDPESPGPVRLLESYDGYDYGHDRRIANAVARLALNAIADRLPQWAAVSANGDWMFARDAQPRRRSAVDPMPRFLLMINWADSGPGFSWPESYHATCLPGFDRFVVTLSDDSPEAHGYTDIAIAHFPASVDFDTEVERIIRDFWSERGSGDPDFAWQDLFADGYIDAKTAYAWRAGVWGVGLDGELIEEEDEEEGLEDGDPGDDIRTARAEGEESEPAEQEAARSEP